MTRGTVIDAHVHFWHQPTPETYPWLTADLAAINRGFRPNDLRPLLAQNGVSSVILVQTQSSLHETREFLAIASECEFIAGVVGWVDLCSPSVQADLADLKADPNGHKLIGVRHPVIDEEPRWLLRPDVGKGLRALAEVGFACEVLVDAARLPALETAAGALSELTFVVDHIAKPAIAVGRRDAAWEAAIKPLAALPNVGFKISSLVTQADWHEWSAEDLAPYVDRAMTWFGPERLLFGSDWPVCLLAATYERVIETARGLLRDLSDADLDAVFGGTARRLYRLPETGLEAEQRSST